jgi:hypothetical protein
MCGGSSCQAISGGWKRSIASFEKRLYSRPSFCLFGFGLQYIDLWRQVGDCISLLDVLFALRMYAMLESARGPLSLPTFTQPSGVNRRVMSD